MKTITEYRPLIFQTMIEHAKTRRIQQREWRRDLLISVSYALVGLVLMVDLKSSPLDWQFWLVFCPLFIVAEAVGRRNVIP